MTAAPGDSPGVVTLRPVEDADLDAFFDFMQDPVAVRQAAFVHRDPSDRAAFDAHWARIRNDPAILNRSILLDGILVGHVASFVLEGRREVTYWVDRATWGRGVATAALRLFLADVDRHRPIHGAVAGDNAASRRVLEKCGFLPDGSGSGFANARSMEIEEWYYRLVFIEPADIQPAVRRAASPRHCSTRCSMGRPVVHWEFWSPDAAKTAEFYKTVFDWSPRTVPELDNYTLVDTGGTGGINGGIMTPQAGPWPAKLSLYIDVDDLDAYGKKITAAGGKMLIEKMDVPGVGQLSLFEDPDGRVLGMWKQG